MVIFTHKAGKCLPKIQLGLEQHPENNLYFTHGLVAPASWLFIVLFFSPEHADVDIMNRCIMYYNYVQVGLYVLYTTSTDFN